MRTIHVDPEQAKALQRLQAGVTAAEERFSVALAVLLAGEPGKFTVKTIRSDGAIVVIDEEGHDDA